MSRKLLSAGLLIVLAATAAIAESAEPTKEWPSWRGPNRDAISTETGLLQKWTAEGPPLQWQINGLGGGYSSIAIAGGKIFTMGRRRGGTAMIALDAKNGKKLWETNVGGGNPNCTPTVDGSLVYALGREGDLICAETETGKEVWRKNFSKDFGGRMMSGWGYSESPLIDGDRLICTPGANNGIIAALDKKTGKTIWKAAFPANLKLRGNDGAGYSSVVVSEARGIRQFVQLIGHGVISVAAKDGKFLWSYDRIANTTANIPTPIVKGDFVFCSTGYGAGAALLRIVPADGGLKAEEVYFLGGGEMQNHHGGMILIGDHIYCGHGHNKGFPLCIEMSTGKTAWRERGPGSGSAAALYADGHLYFRYESGVMALIEATSKQYVLKGSFKIASKKGASWPHPVIVDGRLYLRDQDNLLCYNVKKN